SVVGLLADLLRPLLRGLAEPYGLGAVSGDDNLHVGAEVDLVEEVLGSLLEAAHALRVMLQPRVAAIPKICDDADCRLHCKDSPFCGWDLTERKGSSLVTGALPRCSAE